LSYERLVSAGYPTVPMTLPPAGALQGVLVILGVGVTQFMRGGSSVRTLPREPALPRHF
jgi:hypothetical protein